MAQKMTSTEDSKTLMKMYKLDTTAPTSIWIIDPRKSRLLLVCDTLGLIALAFTVLVTPFEVSFLQSPTTWRDPLFLINRVVDFIFFVDMVLNFVRMVEVGDTYHDEIHWLRDFRSIAITYAKGWFIVDLVSVSASALDFLSLFDSESDNSNVGRLKVLRTVRVFRLIKLARLLRASVTVKRLLTRISVNYAMLSVAKTWVTQLVLAHWISCVWALQAYLQTDISITWLGAKEYCVPLEREEDGGGAVDGAEYDCMAPHVVWAASLYWTVTSITSIGYGDISPTMHNWVEQLVATVLMFVACSLWAQTIAVFCSVLSTFNPESTEAQRTSTAQNTLPFDETISARDTARTFSLHPQPREKRLSPCARWCV